MELPKKKKKERRPNKNSQSRMFMRADFKIPDSSNCNAKKRWENKQKENTSMRKSKNKKWCTLKNEKWKTF